MYIRPGNYRTYLSSNENAIHLLEQNIGKINWGKLNHNLNAPNLLAKYPDKINWSILSLHPNAISLLEKNVPTHLYLYSSKRLFPSGDFMTHLYALSAQVGDD